MNKAVFIRTSTEEQNPENQLNDIELISGKDYILFEEKQSAWKDKDRPIFEGLKKQIQNKKISDLYVWDFDRIYRNRLKFKEFLEYLKAFNVKLHSYRQTWFDDLYKIPNPWNDIVLDLMINIYGHIAEDESNKKSQRIKISVRRESGITKSYKGNKWGRKSLSEDAIKDVLRYHSEGKSLRDISKLVFYWDKNNNKKFLSIGSVHKIVSNYSTNKKS